jgi:hypothetical protein
MDDSESSSKDSELPAREPRGKRAGGYRRLLWLAGGALALGLLALVGSALTPGDSSAGKHRFSVVKLAGKSAPNPLAGRLKRVYGTNVPASRFGTEVADLEDEGTNMAGEKVSELTPLSPHTFERPEDEYRGYARHWITAALAKTSVLSRSIAASDRSQAQAAWKSAWSDYLHLGAVYGLFGELNQQIDGSPGGLPGGDSDPRFSGLHRIEMGLWSGQSLRPLGHYAARLHSDLARLYRVVGHVEITPLEYATRSHEIIEDAQRDLLSGTEVPWSGQGVLGTAAGVAATEEVLHTLRPLLDGRENTEGEVRSELLLLRRALAVIARHHSGRYPSLQALGMDERELLDGTVAGALQALKELPGTLETEAHHPIPKLAPGR